MFTGQMLYEKLLQLRPEVENIPTPAKWEELYPNVQFAYQKLAIWIDETYERVKGEK